MLFQNDSMNEEKTLLTASICKRIGCHPSELLDENDIAQAAYFLPICSAMNPQKSARNSLIGTNHFTMKTSNRFTLNS